MKKKSSSKSAFFNFRVLLLLCAAGAILVLAAFGALPNGSSNPRRSAQDQSGGSIQQPGANSLSPSGPGIVPHQRASSSGFTLMEGPGPDGETVTTDKSDYMPGETVVIGGTGWIPNEAVALNITDSNGVDRWNVSVTADASGNISNSDFVIQAGDVGLAFTLTATQGTVTAWTQFTDVIGSGIAPNGDPGGFEILGNVVASAAPHTDWVDTTPGTNGLVNPTTGVPLDATVTYRRLDAFNTGDDVFAGSNKTNDNPNTYTWKTASAGNKEDMNNVYVHISIDVMGHRWITASADRLANNGTSFVDFELNQATVTKVTDVGCASAPCGHFVTNPLNASTGGRTPNDLLVTAQYNSGGAVATVIVYQWRLVSGTWQWVDITASIGAGMAFVATNITPGPDDHPSGSGTSVPYGAFGGAHPLIYNQNQFVEMSLDLSALLMTIDPCEGIQIKTAFVKTKTSTSTTASLDDLVDPIPVSFGVGLNVTGSQTDPLCNGGTGTVTATWSGGTGPFECKLDVGGTYASCSSPKSYSGLAAGSTHTIFVRDTASTCVKDTGPITLGNPSALVPSSSNTPILCNGGSTTVTVSATGGTPPYTGTGTFARSAGTYSFTVTDSHSCTATTTGNITQPSAVTATSSNPPILCNGGSTTVTVGASGGTGPYQGTGTFSRSAGTYSFTVTDANSCTATTTGNITQPSAVTATSSNPPILCNGGTTVVTVGASGGTGPYQGTGTFTRPAGTYSYTVTDANSCTATTTGNITQPSAVTATSSNPPILCNGGTTVVTVGASGGTGPYQGTGTFTRPAGTYSYTVTDANSCTATTTGNITQPSAVTATSSNPPILCNGGTTTVTVGASGGTAPYSGTGDFVRGAGTYSYTVTDANGCIATTTGDITQPSAVTASSSNTAILCNGGNSTVSVSASGGTAPYSGTGDFVRGAGTYSYTVTDANGCTATTTGDITQPSAVTASSSNTAILCNGGNSTVSVSASGGTAPYSGTGDFSHGAGTYSYTVTDANGCTATTTGDITQPSAVTATSSNPPILCNGGSTTVTVGASGGTGPYQGTGTFMRSAGTYSYTVTDANSCTATTTGEITQPSAVTASSSNTAILCNGGNSTVSVSASGGTAPYSGTGDFVRGAGTYSYTVTDANGCTATTTGDITQPSAVTATSSNPPILCNGGSTTVTVGASGGTAPYSGTGGFVHGAGTYSYTVTDANGCTATTTGDIMQPSAVTASSSNTAILCNGGNSTVSVSASGGTAPYSGTGDFVRGAGTYSYTVTDANGCIATTTGDITQPSAVTASSSNTAILCNGGNSTVSVSASGGTAPYSGTGDFVHGAGTYSYTITDANGCTATTTGNITQPSALTLSLSVTACSGGNNGSIRATFGGGTGPYEIKIDNGNFTTATSPYDFTGLTGGSHTITVRDANLCTQSDSITVDSCPQFCALTQGFYGNAGGVFSNPDNCYNGLGTLALIKALLGDPTFTACGSPNPNPQYIIVGKTGARSVRINFSAASCILTRLPAGGGASALPNNFGDQTLQNSPSCQVPGPKTLPLKNGRFDNVLLGQTIALTFNLRLDLTLADLDLTTIGTPVKIRNAWYRQFCTQSGGSVQTWLIAQSVIDALSNPLIITDPTHRGKVSGLLDLANLALAGLPTGGASISDINAAVDAINTGFDECRRLVTCPTQPVRPSAKSRRF